MMFQSPLIDPSEFLRFHRHTLDNGLRVVLHRDPSLPLVAVNLWYHVGSKNEPPGCTGYAHLLEHLMFQGSENVDTNGHFAQVQRVGGSTNGSTWYDRTNYYEVLPSHRLDLGLWLESDRMGFFLPSVTQEKLDNQREVVINERRQRVDNRPYGRGFERLHELLYGDEEHPYRWPVLGYVEDLEAATLDSVCGFFANHYTPSNAVLTLAGDLDPDDALARIDHWFGEIPGGQRPAPVAAPKPDRRQERRETLIDQVRLPRVYVGTTIPAFGTEDWYVADVLASVLTEGRSSVLYHDLVRERQLAQDVGCYAFPTEEAATYALVATARPGVEADELLAAIDEHLDRVRREPPAANDLERALNRLLTDHHDQLQLLDRRADLLSLYTTYFDEPERLNAEPGCYAAVDGEAITRFADRFLRPERRVVLTVAPDPDSTEGTSDAAESA